MAGPNYTVIPNDWQNLEYIISDLSSRIIDEDKSFSDYILKDGSRAFTGTGIGFKDEDDMASDSAVAVASQQSIKAYVDNNISADPFDIPGKLTAGSFGSPIEETATREYGFEIHYSGNNYNATGIRSRTSAVTTDTTAQFQGGLFQAANNDGINVGVLNGLLAEAIGKSDSTAATISMMRAGIFNAEWNAKDTVTDLRTLHVRTHTRNNATEGYISNSGYGIYIENEAVGGNGQALDAGIYFKGTNLSGGNKAFDYGIDFSGATYNTAEIKFSSGDTIGNLTGGRLDISGDLVAVGDIEATAFVIGDDSLSDEWQYLAGLDQELATDDSPTFAGITISTLDDGRIPYSSNGALYDTGNLTWTSATSTFGTDNIEASGSISATGAITSSGNILVGAEDSLVLPRTSNYGYTLGHSGTATSNAARGSFYPQNADSGMTFYLIPRGTSGFSSQTLLSLFNTDFVADTTNYERLSIGAFKTSYIIDADAAGTGSKRPIYFRMDGSDAITIDTSVNVDVPNDLTAGTIQADNGYSGSWVNNEGNTVTVLGGIITDVS